LTQQPIKLGVLEQRHVGVTTDRKKVLAPAENTVVTIASTKQFNGEISPGVADPINQLAALETDSKTTAHDFSILQRSRDFLQTTGWHLAIGMNEPEHLAARCVGAGIHLRRTPATARQNAVAKRDGTFRYGL